MHGAAFWAMQHHTHRHTDTQTHRHTDTQTHTRTQTHTHTLIHRLHTHTHTRTLTSPHLTCWCQNPEWDRVVSSFILHQRSMEDEDDSNDVADTNGAGAKWNMAKLKVSAPLPPGFLSLLLWPHVTFKANIRAPQQRTNTTATAPPLSLRRMWRM